MCRPRPVALLLPLLILMTGCGGDDTTAPAPGIAAEDARDIPPGGGSVTVEAAGGVRLTVALPAGAMLEPTRVALRATAAPVGVLARFALEPSGLDLLVPATFTVTLPAGMALPADLGLSFVGSERVPVPALVDAGARTLTATLPHLGFGDLAALRGGAVAAAAAPAAVDEFIDVEALGCQFLQDSLADALLRAEAFVGPFPPDLASPLIQQYRTALLSCGADSLADQQAAFQAVACAKADGATLNAQVVLVETAQDLKQSLGFLMAAAGMVQLVDADCEIAVSLLETEFAEFLQAYIGRIENPGFVADFPTWDALWRELVVCVEVAAMAQEFAVPEAESTIYNTLFPALYARLREVAAGACGEDENNSYYVDILTGGHQLGHPVIPQPGLPPFADFAQEELVDEMHRCSNAVTVQARTQDGVALDAATVTGGTGSVRVIDQGRLIVTGDILNFVCGGLVSRPPIRVRAELPGRLPTVSLGALAGPLTVDVGAVLGSLPEPGGEPARGFDLVLERDRAVCGIDAPGAVELCRVSVDTQGFEGSLAGSWSGSCGEPVGGTFAIQVARDGTVSGTYTGSGSGTITGTVTADGTLDASASGGAGGCTWAGTLSMAGGILGGSGTWSCAGGCAGVFSAP